MTEQLTLYPRPEERGFTVRFAKKYLDDIIYILEEFLKYITYDMVKINQKLKHIHYTQFYHPEYFNEILRCISIKTIYLKQYYEPILL